MRPRLAALGDSISCGEGVGVGVGPDDAWVGVLARSLDAELDVLATPGVRIDHVRHVQLPGAIARRSTYASLLIGLNDMVAARFDAAQVRDDLLHTVGELHEAGHIVLLGRLHDPTALIPTPRWIRRRFLERVDVVNAAVDDARALGVHVVDLGRIPALQSRGGWALDRVHPGLTGHRAIAAAAVTALTEGGVRVPAPIPAPVVLHANSRLAEMRWLAQHGAPYLAKKAREKHYREWETVA